MRDLLFVILLTTAVSGCYEESKTRANKPTSLEITLNESFHSFVERYPSVRKTQPLGEKGGAIFYKFFWSEEESAKIIVNYGSGEIEIDNVINFNMLESDYKSKEGITHITFDAGITYDKTINHDEARLKFHEFLQKLANNGWKRMISLAEPRLFGSQAMHYTREKDSTFSLDTNYLPSLKEWMAIDKLGTYWQLQLDNRAFMSIDLKRRDSKTESDMGIYLLSITIKNDQEMGRSHFPPQEKENWNDLKKWEETKDKYFKLREGTEKDLLSKGYKIDESYEDYDISPHVSE